MLLAYMHCFGTEANYPELCIVPDKPDQFSVPVRVDTLRVTDVAIYRMGPQEALNISNHNICMRKIRKNLHFQNLETSPT